LAFSTTLEVAIAGRKKVKSKLRLMRQSMAASDSGFAYGNRPQLPRLIRNVIHCLDGTETEHRG
jgi:hypothetical protein